MNLPGDGGFEPRARRASLLLAGLLSCGLLVSLLLARPEPLALAGPFGLALLVVQLRAFAAHSRWPDLITGSRVLLTSGLAWSGLQQTAAVQMGLVLTIFVLDGLDGLLARRTHSTSKPGAHFDMESDAYLVLVVCTLHLFLGTGSWVLTGGLLRYVYVLTTGVLAPRGEAPRSRFGRYAFATSLGLLTTGLWPGRLAQPLAALGTLVLCWSFARSFYWSFRAG